MRRDAFYIQPDHAAYEPTAEEARWAGTPVDEQLDQGLRIEPLIEQILGEFFRVTRLTRKPESRPSLYVVEMSRPSRLGDLVIGWADTAGPGVLILCRRGSRHARELLRLGYCESHDVVYYDTAADLRAAFARRSGEYLAATRS